MFSLYSQLVRSVTGVGYAEQSNEIIRFSRCSHVAEEVSYLRYGRY